MLNLEQELQIALADCGGELANQIVKVPPRHAAILPSEMLAYCALAWQRGCRTVIESGRREGYSTEVLSLFFRVVSLETTPAPEADARFADERFAHVQLIRRDACRYLPDFEPEEATALLLDGPKGQVAMNLLQQIGGDYLLKAIHDAHPGSWLRANLPRSALLTDRDWFLEEWGWLDREMLKHRGHKDHKELLDAGNVLAIFP